MADWNPQPHNDLPQNSQKIKLCIVLWETFVLPGSGCDYSKKKRMYMGHTRSNGNKNYEHEEENWNVTDRKQSLL